MVSFEHQKHAEGSKGGATSLASSGTAGTYLPLFVDGWLEFHIDIDQLEPHLFAANSITLNHDGTCGFGKEKVGMSNTLVNTHIRLELDSYEAAKEIAGEYGLSFSQVVRLALADNLDKLAKKVKYRDKEQAEEIRSVVMEILNKVEVIETNLRRLGNNTNQIARYYNTQRLLEEEQNQKFPSTAKLTIYQNDLDSLHKQIQNSYSKDELEKLIDDFESTVANLSEFFWQVCE